MLTRHSELWSLTFDKVGALLRVDDLVTDRRAADGVEDGVGLLDDLVTALQALLPLVDVFVTPLVEIKQQQTKYSRICSEFCETYTLLNACINWSHQQIDE